MKALAVFAMVLLACEVESPVLDTEETAHVEHEVETPVVADEVSSFGAGQCGVYTPGELNASIAGTEVVVEVPVLCEPSYLDEGNPPPDSEVPADWQMWTLPAQTEQPEM